jgi:hypothetical protein
VSLMATLAVATAVFGTGVAVVGGLSSTAKPAESAKSEAAKTEVAAKSETAKTEPGKPEAAKPAKKADDKAE